jgi:glycerol-3-phosphate dehydrogenase (NAD(P)+)
MRRGNRGERITVIGNGGWGTALALVLVGNGHRVRLWGAFSDSIALMRRERENIEFLPGIPLPEDLELHDDAARALEGCDLWINAIPTKYIRDVMERLRGVIPTGVPFVSVSKGIENRSLLRASQVVTDVIGRRELAVLSGPSHAEEVARGLPTSVVVASRGEKLARRVQRLFQSERFRVYTNTDFVGVELGGALKNVIAIAAGICDGLGFGDNTKSALVTRGLVEIARLGVALGARKSTFSGLAGIGDLITTCFSRHGRNRAVGEAIGSGATLDDVLGRMRMVAEGVWTTRSVVEVARERSVEMPIADQVHRVLFRGKSPDRAVGDLMRRAMKSETEDLG